MRSILMMLACACACASTQITQPKQPISESEMVEIEVQAGTHHILQPRLIDDTDAYQASLNRIEQVMSDERLQLAMCAATQPKIECDALQSKFCQVPELIDSRGGRHFKPYCLSSLFGR